MMSRIRCTCHDELVALATAEKIVLCEDTLDGIRKGVADLKAGRIRPWREVRKGLGLDGLAVSGLHDDDLIVQ